MYTMKETCSVNVWFMTTTHEDLVFVSGQVRAPCALQQLQTVWIIFHKALKWERNKSEGDTKEELAPSDVACRSCSASVRPSLLASEGVFNRTQTPRRPDCKRPQAQLFTVILKWSPRRQKVWRGHDVLISRGPSGQGWPLRHSEQKLFPNFKRWVQIKCSLVIFKHTCVTIVAGRNPEEQEDG